MAGPMLDMCQEPQADDCVAIVTRSSYGEAICGTTDDERMGTHTNNGTHAMAYFQGEAIALCRPARTRGKRFPIGGFRPR